MEDGSLSLLFWILLNQKHPNDWVSNGILAVVFSMNVHVMLGLLRLHGWLT